MRVGWAIQVRSGCLLGTVMVTFSCWDLCDQRRASLMTFFFPARCLSGSISRIAHPHRHPSLLSGVGCWPEDPPGQYRSVELRLPSVGGHWICQLPCKCLQKACGGFGTVVWMIDCLADMCITDPFPNVKRA